MRSLVTEMTDPGDELQASHPLRDAKVVVEDIEDNRGFFRVKLFAVPHFRGRHGCEPVSGEPDAESESVRR